jgi:heme-degrading monooxygenase HmoA
MVVKQLVARPTPPPVTHHRSRSASTGSLELSPVEKQAQKEPPMFTRVVEVNTNSGKAQELTSIINDKVLPILKKQVGFVDETVLASDTDPNRVLALSFWNTREDAERYNREQYPAVHEMVRHLLETEPAIRTFNVDTSTTHKITASIAA